jgi:DNA-binding transcriptional MerR regulator
MAKKKMLQQLDLFGGLFAEEVTPAKEVKPKKVRATAATIVEPQIVEAASNESTTTDNRDVIFADNNIGVKIKLKPTNVETTETVSENTLKQPEQSNKKQPTKNNQQKTDKQKPKSKRGRKSFKEMDAEIGLVNIPDDEILNKKLYYPIREVAAFFNVNTSLIRAWEVEFDVLQPRKNRKGDRLFRVEDIKNLQIIYFLLRNKKFSVDGAKKYLKENKTKVDTNQQLLHSLTKFRSFLVELKHNLQHS